MNKKFLIMIPVIFLTMLVFLFNSSYAIYSTSATGNSNINTSAWIIYVNDIDMVQNLFFTLDTSDIEIDNTNAHAMDGVVAPGSVVTIPIVIDGSDAEVPIDYELEIGDPYYYSENIIIGNESFESSYNDISDAFTINVVSGSLTGTINQTNNDTTANIEIELEWNKASDSTSNIRDMTIKNQAIYVPITVITSQHITTPSP